jgi:hypothetical protein
VLPLQHVVIWVRGKASNAIAVFEKGVDAVCAAAQSHGRYQEPHRFEMLTGKRFRLKTDTMGIGTVNDKRVAVTVPAGAIIAYGPKTESA